MAESYSGERTADMEKCPVCVASIPATHRYSWCSVCGQDLPAEIKRRLPAIDESLTRESAAAQAKAQAQAQNASTTSGSPVVDRYRDAYRVAAAQVGLGDVIKIVGGILAGIIGLGALSAGGVFAAAGVFVALIAGVLFWVCGVLVAAVGQMLRATLDTAVASSPFLSDHERLDAMGLPRRMAEREAGA